MVNFGLLATEIVSLVWNCTCDVLLCKVTSAFSDKMDVSAESGLLVCGGHLCARCPLGIRARTRVHDNYLANVYKIK